MENFHEPSGQEVPLPLDIDIHEIPARGDEPAHLHHDLRYLLIAGPDQALQISPESKDLRWIPRDRVVELTDEESVLRLERKAVIRLGSTSNASALAGDAVGRERG